MPCVLTAQTYNSGGARLTLPQGLTLRGAGIGQTVIASNVLMSGRLNVSDLTIGVNGEYSSIANGSTNSSFTRVQFSQGASQGNIYVQNVAGSQFTFELCEFSDNAAGGDAVCLVDKGTTADHLEDFLFFRCRFYNNDRMNLEVLQRSDQGPVTLGYRRINCDQCYFGPPVGGHSASSTNNVSYDSMELASDGVTPSSGYSSFTKNHVVGGHYALEIAEAIA